VLARPLADLNGRIDHCRRLEEQLEDAVASRRLDNRYLDNFAPLLLMAIARSLMHRHFHNAKGASDFESTIGSLIPRVRDDGAAAMEAARQ
jgi:hypothetical protein